MCSVHSMKYISRLPLRISSIYTEIINHFLDFKAMILVQYMEAALQIPPHQSHDLLQLWKYHPVDSNHTQSVIQ